MGAFFFLFLPLQDIFIEEGILQTDGIDQTVNNHRLLPFLGSIKMFDPQSILLSQMNQGGLIEREDLIRQLLKNLFHPHS